MIRWNEKACPDLTPTNHFKTCHSSEALVRNTMLKNAVYEIFCGQQHCVLPILLQLSM